MRRDTNLEAFFALVRGGLWEQNVQLAQYGTIDYEAILRLSEEQSVVGLVTAGLDHVTDTKVPQVWLLQFIGETMQLEQTNANMNAFIADTIEKMRQADIYALLVKGQGIAQCYERPLWRTSGDIDLFLSDTNYEKAKKFFMPLSTGQKEERTYSKELGLDVDGWFVELHGTQRTGLSTRLDTVIDEVQRDIFYGGNVRSWISGKTYVFLPDVNEDIFFVFTHFIKHLYKEEGVCLRQVCDLCRLIWTYRDKVDSRLLESRFRRAGVMAEWIAFAALAVGWMGMPAEVMPLYSENGKWKRKAGKIMDAILDVKEPSRWRAVLSNMKIFPVNTICFLPGILFDVNWLKVKERFQSYVTHISRKNRGYTII